ncbi:hypothetical protein [Amycolatopsis saalfeldensis]|uniref:Uncharacterized protein n=1 Tax=Amycolatopsis saalfeldensis TaxID=394193 RepID=A0A1H8XGS4_9PSEU|nr:hypothetical protein [Amycolatopsis saalfeldensis]SEP39170.1 hypothetical protein SAMN04489732_107233 [Amycolatopsis saalfeldensis]
MDTHDPAAPGEAVLGWVSGLLQGHGGLLDGVAVRPRVRADGQVWLSWPGGPAADAVATALLTLRDPDFPVEPVPSSQFWQARLRVGGVLVVLDTPDRAHG